MSKKILIMLVAVVTGAFMASVAVAADSVSSDGSYSFLGYRTRLEITGTVATSGQTAGTILNPEGKGDALIAAYYDVRAVNNMYGVPKAQDTYFAIINENIDKVQIQALDDHNGVAAKLRFREWDKSEEVFDIDIWLSDNDVWVGVLTRNPVNGLTRLWSPDYVIIAGLVNGPTFTVTKTNELSMGSGMDFFTDWAPGGANNAVSPPTGFTAADLTNMGYFEVIGEERTYTNVYQATATSPILVTRFSGVNSDCLNSLSAYVYIVRVDDGVSLGYNAAAIANFSKNLGSIYYGPGSPAPALSECEDGLDQLEFELSKELVYHGYSVETEINARFSQIVTFPTKHFHFEKHSPRRLDYTLCAATSADPTRVCTAIGAPFIGSTANYGEQVEVTIFDRNENKYSPTVGFWSPRTTPTLSLPWEVNVVGLYPGAVPTVPAIGNRNNVAWTTGTPGFPSGWLWINLHTNVISSVAFHHGDSPHKNTNPHFGHLGNEFESYSGMPALSLALQEFSNANVGGAYGVIFPAFYRVHWDLVHLVN